MILLLLLFLSLGAMLIAMISSMTTNDRTTRIVCNHLSPFFGTLTGVFLVLFIQSL